MSLSMRKTVSWVVGALLVVVLAAAAFVWSGVYDVGADDTHTAPVHAILELLRDRSIAVRTSELDVPDMDDEARITQGAGNYAAMCTGCHLAPGMTGTEMSRGLSPAPPDLTRQTVDPAKAFWVIKHGIKASGMPAWGRSMDDAYIWNMVAFLQVLPRLDPAGYQALVASSEGHSHGGGETAHDTEAAPGMMEHRHADGTVESHPVAPAEPAGDGHDHEH